MSIVYVLGAGASHGDDLRNNPIGMRREPTAAVPVANGFFRSDFLKRLGYDIRMLRKDFPEALDYIARTEAIFEDGIAFDEQWKNMDSDRWTDIDLERAFTSIELDREFWGAQSDYGGHLTLVRNKLMRVIFRAIGLCTDTFYGQHVRTLATRLSESDSVITFNWDLLLDQELYPGDDAKPQYRNFLISALEGNAGMAVDYSPNKMGGGLFLKMHGSMNWFKCTNAKCPASQSIFFDEDFHGCLSRHMGIHWKDESCSRCGSDTEPLIIPPLLRKPIADDWIVRCIWGLARKKLRDADVLVMIGFSAPPTDFYAAWLLHSTAGLRGIPVYLVNPENDKPDFRARMQRIFPRGFNTDFKQMSQIENVIGAATTTVTKVQRDRMNEIRVRPA